MLFTKLSMQSFILDNLLNKIENKIVIEKSPFNDDNTTDYIIEIITIYLCFYHDYFTILYFQNYNCLILIQ